MDINHISQLARLDLSEEEKQKFAKELDAILGFVEKLKEADVKNINPMAGGTDLNNITRDDAIGERDLKQKQEILDNVPKKKDDYVEVKAVFE